MRPHVRGMAGLLVAAVPLAGCGRAEPADAGRSGTVTVLAAASLTDAFEAIGESFEAVNLGMAVRFSFAGSQQLATQVLDGAPADVLATAHPSHLETVADAGLVAGPPVTFATNRLAIAVAPGNPAGVGGLADLADPALKVVVAAPAVPAGRYTEQLLAAAGVTLSPVSLQTDVRAVAGTVALGEADAGIVYASDVAAARGRVTAVPIPDAVNVTATYPIATLAKAADAAAADAFVAFVRSPAGQDLLAAHGFEAAP